MRRSLPFRTAPSSRGSRPRRGGRVSRCADARAGGSRVAETPDVVLPYPDLFEPLSVPRLTMCLP